MRRVGDQCRGAADLRQLVAHTAVALRADHPVEVLARQLADEVEQVGEGPAAEHGHQLGGEVGEVAQVTCAHLSRRELRGGHGQRGLGDPGVLTLQQPHHQVVGVAPDRPEQRHDGRDQLDVGIGQPRTHGPEHRPLGGRVLEQGERRLEAQVVGRPGSAGDLADEPCGHLLGVAGAQEEPVVPGERHRQPQPTAAVHRSAVERPLEQSLQRLRRAIGYAGGRMPGRPLQCPHRREQPTRGQSEQPLVPEGDLDRRLLPAGLPAADPARVRDQGRARVVGHGLQPGPQVRAGQAEDRAVRQVQPAGPGAGVDDLGVPRGVVLRQSGRTSHALRVDRSGATTRTASRGH